MWVCFTANRNQIIELNNLQVVCIFIKYKDYSGPLSKNNYWFSLQNSMVIFIT